jgi:hypothetical protein
MNTFDDKITQYLYQDYDSDDEFDTVSVIRGDGGDGGCGDERLDTKWIHEIENQIICDDYIKFIKSDIDNVTFEFIYLNLNKEIVNIDRCVLSLMKPNAITQNEIFQLIQKKQRVPDRRKYYNFMSLCFYHFYVNDDPKSVSQYVCSDGGGGSGDELDYTEGGGNIIEYTNILSIETIYLKPLIRMFHDLNCFTVVLFED